ncbi:unnamed protein product [Absidia cylindrospora]
MTATSSNKRQRLIPPPHTTATTTNNEQLNSEDDDFIRIRKPGKGKKFVVYLESDTDSTDENQSSIITDTTKQNKRSARDILDDDTSTVEFYPNGTILIRPGRRPLRPGLGTLIVRYLSSQQDLYAFALVNKQCYSAANPLLWKHPKIRNRTTLPLLLACLTDRVQQPMGRQIRRLDLKVTDGTDDQFSTLLAYMPNLEVLRLDGFPYTLANNQQTLITNDSFRHVARHCPKLVSLLLIAFDLLPGGLDAFAHHCPLLCQISLESFVHFPPDMFDALARCPQLQHMQISSRSSTTTVPPNSKYLGLAKLRHLTHLDMSHAWDGSVDALFTQTNASTWPHLIHLRVTSISKEASFIQFLHAHPHIQHLSLTGFYELTDTVLDAMATALPHLTSVDLMNLDGISSDGIRQLVRHAPHLTLVNITSCALEYDRKAPDFTLRTLQGIVLDQVKLNRIRSGVNEF